MLLPLSLLLRRGKKVWLGEWEGRAVARRWRSLGGGKGMPGAGKDAKRAKTASSASTSASAAATAQPPTQTQPHAQKKPLLITGTTSSSSWRVRACLAFKKVEFDMEVVDVARGEASGVSPMDQVPVLRIDGHELRQSVAIVEYLDHTRPEPPLFPRPPHLKAKVREIVETINSGIQPLQNLGVLQRVSSDERAQKEFARAAISKGLGALERILTEVNSGDFCVGTAVSAADLFLVPQAFNAIRYDVDVTAFPRVNRVFLHVGALPWMARTSPPNVVASGGAKAAKSSSSAAAAPAATAATTSTAYKTGAPRGEAHIVSNREANNAECRWVSLRLVSYVDHRGVTRPWEAVQRRTRPAGAVVDGVMIVARVLRKGKPATVALVSQFRPATAGRTLEFPAGLLDPNESVEEAAKRELYEETGLTAKRVASVSPPLFLDPGLSNSALRAVIIDVDGDAPENRDAKPHAPDDVEDVRVVWFPEPHTTSHLETLAASAFPNVMLHIDANLWCWFASNGASSSL